ncbi:hypothetical protein PWT90_04274 [Aphanocladium album]|nr:hypothetical protein PWT90_04274 [Aphanocladium album]
MDSSKESKKGRDTHTSGHSSTQQNESLKKENTGPINTATNHTDENDFTHPQPDNSAPVCESKEPDSAVGVTVATNHTDDKGFTTPGEDMSKGCNARKL